PAILACGRLINNDPQHAALSTAAELHLHHFKSTSGGDALRNLAHSLGVNCHLSSNLGYLPPTPFCSDTKMSTCAHWSASQLAATVPKEESKLYREWIAMLPGLTSRVLQRLVFLFVLHSQHPSCRDRQHATGLARYLNPYCAKVASIVPTFPVRSSRTAKRN